MTIVTKLTIALLRYDDKGYHEEDHVDDRYDCENKGDDTENR